MAEPAAFRAGLAIQDDSDPRARAFSLMLPLSDAHRQSCNRRIADSNDYIVYSAPPAGAPPGQRSCIFQMR